MSHQTSAAYNNHYAYNNHCAYNNTMPHIWYDVIERITNIDTSFSIKKYEDCIAIEFLVMKKPLSQEEEEYFLQYCDFYRENKNLFNV